MVKMEYPRKLNPVKISAICIGYGSCMFYHTHRDLFRGGDPSLLPRKFLIIIMILIILSFLFVNVVSDGINFKIFPGEHALRPSSLSLLLLG